MIRHIAILCSLTFLLTACSEAPSNNVVATYDGGVVEKEEVDTQVERLTRYNEKLKDATFESLDVSFREEIIREIVAKKVISKQARKAKTHKKEAVRKAVTEFETRLIQKEFLFSIAKQEATESKVQQKYNILSENLKGQEERKIKHILVENEQKARTLHAKVTANKKQFDTLAKKHSKDPLSAKKGGDLGYVLPGQMVKPFEDAAFALTNKGDISAPTKSDFGWHIIMLQDIRNAKAAPYEEVSDAIKQELMQQAINSYIEGQLKAVKIQTVMQ